MTSASAAVGPGARHSRRAEALLPTALRPQQICFSLSHSCALGCPGPLLTGPAFQVLAAATTGHRFGVHRARLLWQLAPWAMSALGQGGSSWPPRQPQPRGTLPTSLPAPTFAAPALALPGLTPLLPLRPPRGPRAAPSFPICSSASDMTRLPIMLVNWGALVVWCSLHLLSFIGGISPCPGPALPLPTLSTQGPTRPQAQPHLSALHCVQVTAGKQFAAPPLPPTSIICQGIWVGLISRSCLPFPS